MKNWLPLRDEYLDELIRGEGRGANTSDTCNQCNAKVDLYRCKDCSAPPLLCAKCTATTHTHTPFHRPCKWTGKYFEPTTLASLGLRIQLGHRVGQRCALPVAARQKMVVIDTNGIHPVSIDYCGCNQAAAAGNIRQQLLRYRLYPATDQSPMTCATFNCLESAHLQSVQAKVGVYDIYMSLERLTDNTGLLAVRVSTFIRFALLKLTR